MTNLTMLDRMIVEGINCLGYGTIPKAVMRDTALTIRAKAIYAYLCSLSGSGSTAFPSRDTIQKHLGLGNKSYYANRKLLENEGYLKIEQKRIGNQAFTTNCFTLIANPKKFLENEPDSEWGKTQYNTIRKKGLKGGGYGEIPRAVMFDPRLDAGTKGVYAYFASYAGAGCSAFPSVPKVLRDLQISHGTYQKAISLLQMYGYLEIHQRNNVSGKKGFSVNDYILLDKPIPPGKDDLPHTKNAHTSKSDLTHVDVENPVDNLGNDVENSIPCAKKEHTRSSPYTKKAYARNAYTKKEHTNNNTNQTNNMFQNTSPPDQSISKAPAENFENSMMDRYKEEIRNSVHYEDIPVMSPHTSMSAIDSLIAMMADACAGGGTVRIGGQNIPKQQLRKVFLSLEWEHLVYVLECVEKQKTEIHNVRAYYLTALYRAPETMEAYYDRMVAEDEAQPHRGYSLAADL